MTRVAVLFVLLALVTDAPASARVFVSRDQALIEAFPGAEVVRRTAVLDDAQAERLGAQTGDERRSRLAAWYEARRDGALVGVAWLDAHVVRTKPEALMVVLTPDGVVLRVDVLSFDEPSDYLAPARWIQQLVGSTVDDDLRPGRDLAGLGGATLTARAMATAVRRCLALDAIARRLEVAPPAVRP